MAQTFVGVDGCPGGWFAVVVDDQSRLSFGMFPTIDALWDAHQSAQILLIDIPIGLGDMGQRACDIEARRVLDARRSSVFPVPTRAALYASSYEEASALNRHVSGLKLSKQTWNIIPKIRQVDELLRGTPEARHKIAEIHPEVLFWGLHGAPMAHSKKTQEGFEERLNILRSLNSNAEAMIGAALREYSRADVIRDDILDALVAALVAQLGDFASLPPRPPRDGHGLPMQILYAHGPHFSVEPRILGLHHAQVMIPDGLEIEARQFYCGVLDFKEMNNPDPADTNSFWLRVGDVRVRFIASDDPEAPIPETSLAYMVDSLNRWIDFLTTRDIAITELPPATGYRHAVLYDPFGNRLLLIQAI